MRDAPVDVAEPAEADDQHGGHDQEAVIIHSR